MALAGQLGSGQQVDRDVLAAIIKEQLEKLQAREAARLQAADAKLQFDGNIVLRSANLAEFAQWLRADAGAFADGLTGPFALNGSLRIRLVARDFDGLEAEVSFTVNYGN